MINANSLETSDFPSKSKNVQHFLSRKLAFEHCADKAFSGGGGICSAVLQWSDM